MAITKNRQSQEVLGKICENAFAEKGIMLASTELTDGFCNAAYDIQLRSGKSVILKAATLASVKMMSYEVDMMKTEVGAMRLAREKGISGIPEVYYYDDSCEISSSACFVMEKLEGKRFCDVKYTMNDKEISDVHIQIGRYLSDLHQIRHNQFGHFCNEKLQKDNWFDTFEMMLQSVIQDGINANIDIGVPYTEIQELLSKQKHVFSEVTEASLVHWDSWEGNIFVNNGVISGFIDWERAMWGDPLMEDRFRAHSVNSDFLEGYGIKEFTKMQKARCRWYDVYLYLIMMFEGFYRQYPDDSQYQWVHAVFIPIWEEMKKFV